MYTQCPTCHTYFRITPEQLQAAGGKVRCGECRGVFHAPDFLTDTLPGHPAAEPPHDEPDYEQLLREPEQEPIVAEEPCAAESAPAAEDIASQITEESAAEEAQETLAIDLDELFGSDTEEATETTAAAEDADTPVEAIATPEPATTAATYDEEDIEALLKFGPHSGDGDDAPQTYPLPWDEPPVEDSGPASTDIDTASVAVAEFDQPEEALTTARSVAPAALSPLSALLAEEEEAPRRRPLATLGWTLGSLLLIAVLAVQFVYLNRLTFVQQAELRPLLEQLCAYTGCRLPPRRDLAALTLLERDIRSHEQYQGALTIHATLQNRAAFAQPYPAVEVVMRDLGGKVVAWRRFLPKEYLVGSVPAMLEPQATAQLTLEVVDPGSEAVGFEFTFH
ncbi:DUF3426 domain-containing protein [Sulfurivermis fontis]|uniref:DUF3426 domain-containing protein n=1 Tax=Sulfurivermis fontis TaxID=1972068 RepID=UPI000FDB6275|nr:DUF3426 domain-containing protein [Sulfurivermis fontis]